MLLGGAVLVIALFMPLGASLADKYGHGFTMALGTAMAGVGIAALAFAGSMVYILAGMLLVAFGSGGFLASNTASAANLIPAMHAAKFKGLANLTTLAAARVCGTVRSAPGFRSACRGWKRPTDYVCGGDGDVPDREDRAAWTS